MPNWALIAKLDKESRKEPDRFDKHLSGDIYDVPIRPDLTPEERIDAEFWKQHRRGLWHVMGQPGGGKDSFVNMVAYKYKYYFGATPVLDYKPCSPFGFYEFFDVPMLIKQLSDMAKKAKINIEKLEKNQPKEVKEESFDRLSNELSKEFGNKFRNSIIVLNEYPRYREKRHPHKPINILMSHIETVFRHWDTLIIGIMTNKDMIDFRSFEHLTMKVTCIWNGEKHRSEAFMQPMRFIKSIGTVKATGSLKIYPVEIFKPRNMLLSDTSPLWISELGKKRIDQWIKGELIAEEIAGISYIEKTCTLDNVKLTKNAMDMMLLLSSRFPNSTGLHELATACQTDTEIAKTLIFNLAKFRYIDGLCWKDLFNSKNDIALSIPKSLIKEGALI